MEIFEPLSILGGISLLLFGISYFLKTVTCVFDYDVLKRKNEELRRENSLLRSIKGVEDK